jgi:hypothetical protein
MTYVTTYKDVDTGTGQRMQAFEVVDKANEDALWEHNEWRNGCVNKACEAIRALGKDFTRDQLFTILCTAETTLYEHGEPELADQVGSFACEVQ